MIEKALVIVPHPDDEINIAGGVFDLLSASSVKTTVVICTNGDYYRKLANIRISEARKVKDIFRYDRLIFLGYGDGYDSLHIYDAEANEVVTSHCGCTETYCCGDFLDYSFERTGEHHKYTRENFKNDIKGVVLEHNYDIIFCVDNDLHPDHRCVSLLFDEAVCEIIREHNDFHPIILKGFAYLGVWKGNYDFFDSAIQSVKPSLNGYESEDYSYPHLWKERVRIQNDIGILSLNPFKNKVFRALLANWTQAKDALSCFPRIANPESCFWYRDVSNLCIKASIRSSSGNPKFLNDFLLFRPVSIRDNIDEIKCSDQCWTSGEDDHCPRIEITFNKLVTIRQIQIYQYGNSRVNSILFQGDHGYSHSTSCNCIRKLNLRIPECKTSRLTLEFPNNTSVISIDEIECYEYISEFPWKRVPFQRYCKSTVKRNSFYLVLLKFTYRCFLKFIDIVA